jgi:hypothetical protein
LNRAALPSPPYLPKADHRDATAKKSQWWVTERREEGIFRHALSALWCTDQKAWGLRIDDDFPDYLGESARDPGPVEPLAVAFFEVGNPSHGYPSYCRPGDKDAIPARVLADWLAQGLLSKAKIRKLGKGQRCKL